MKKVLAVTAFAILCSFSSLQAQDNPKKNNKMTDSKMKNKKMKESKMKDSKQ